MGKSAGGELQTPSAALVLRWRGPRRPASSSMMAFFFLFFLVLFWSEHSVVMRGEERDAEATPVHATYIQYHI